MKMGKTNENSNEDQPANAEKRKANDKPAKENKIKTKRRKKKLPTDAPKHPLTGYVRFMNVRREELRKIHPNATAVEITKIIGEEWNALNETDRRPYLEAASIDKERYNREWMAYIAKKKSDESSSETTEIPSNKTNGVDTKLKETIASKAAQHLDHDIPIFTEEFLEHNKIMDTNLRTIRKTNTDYEQQNSILERHAENMESGIQKLSNEINEFKSNYDILNNYLLNLKKKLSNALSGLAIPSMVLMMFDGAINQCTISGEPNGANLENIDKYMADLHKMATSNSHGPASLNKAKDIIRKLDLHNASSA